MEVHGCLIADVAGSPCEKKAMQWCCCWVVPDHQMSAVSATNLMSGRMAEAACRGLIQLWRGKGGEGWGEGGGREEKRERDGCVH